MQSGKVEAQKNRAHPLEFKLQANSKSACYSSTTCEEALKGSSGRTSSKLCTDLIAFPFLRSLRRWEKDTLGTEELVEQTMGPLSEGQEGRDVVYLI